MHPIDVCVEVEGRGGGRGRGRSNNRVKSADFGTKVLDPPLHRCPSVTHTT